MSDYISKSAVIELIESKMTEGCLGTEDDTFIGGHGLVDDIFELPTLDEKEIIRKPFERVVERLKNLYPINPYPNQFSNGRDYANGRAIQIVKEEGGIE